MGVAAMMYGGKSVEIVFLTQKLIESLGGTDTTKAALHNLVVQLILKPEIQQRAQEELNKVIGRPDSPEFRLPSFDDRPNLPYIQAIMKEALRWRPPIATGIPHANLKDDIYRGWKIPKGSIIFANAWAMMRDERVYRDPHIFRPERFIDSEKFPAETDPGNSGVFGFGRR